MGLAWTDQCFCANSYNNGNGNNANQADCPGGECPIFDCDADGVLVDGVADLCANGGVGSCGNRNAVYSLTYAISETPVSTTTRTLARLEMQLELADQRSLDLRMVRVEARETFGNSGAGLGTGLSLQGESTCRAEHIEFVGNTQRGIGARPLRTLSPMLGLPSCQSLTALRGVATICRCGGCLRRRGIKRHAFLRAVRAEPQPRPRRWRPGGVGAVRGRCFALYFHRQPHRKPDGAGRARCPARLVHHG